MVEEMIPSARYINITTESYIRNKLIRLCIQADLI